ncbi:hypothetical protein JTE90_018886 [Oedothorax gibbosus]|uniref:Sodium-dependent glucose transporter 1 n=1 Tax=Oedothorax gibbosus TaxID=931172 RepID=A0AAV6UCF5_9ARAC|nr:hypothetical protein JTE90_018886 [Oedothorax gibbosus]
MTIFTPKRLRIIKTCNLYISSIASGMSMAVAGPTLLDLQHVVHTDTKQIALVYTGRSSGYLLGSIIGGVLFDMTARKQFLMTIFNFLIAVTMFAVPLSGSIEILTGWMVVNGASLGAVDTGLNVCILNLWGKDSGPYYQALHFVYGVGGLISPLIVAPFLGHYILEEQQKALNTSVAFLNQSSAIFQENVYQNTSVPSGPSVHPVFYGYAIIASTAFVVTILFLVVCIIAPLDSMGQKTGTQEIRELSKSFIFVVVLLNFLLLFVETGTEIGYAQMVATYAVKGPLRLTPAVGSYLTSTFWGTFTVSRFSTIFLSLKFSNLSLILFELLIASVGALILHFLSGTQEWALWLASALLGFGIAPLFPTAIAWIEQYITVTNKFVALFATGCAFGEMVIPYTITTFIEEVPEVLSYVVTASCVLSALFIFGLYLLLRNKQNKYVEKEGMSNAACDANMTGESAT